MVQVPVGLYPRVATPVAVVGSSIVLLLACAALANAALQGAAMPYVLRRGAVIAHLATVLLALPLGISQLVLPKGTIRHRVVGYVWCGLMMATALISFAVHGINPGGLSFIHLFSIMTLVMTPVIVFSARAGQAARHQRAVLGLMIGALVIAGLFTFLPGRALGELVGQLFAAWR